MRITLIFVLYFAHNFKMSQITNNIIILQT